MTPEQIAAVLETARAEQADMTDLKPCPECGAEHGFHTAHSCCEWRAGFLAGADSQVIISRQQLISALTPEGWGDGFTESLAGRILKRISPLLLNH